MGYVGWMHEENVAGLGRTGGAPASPDPDAGTHLGAGSTTLGSPDEREIRQLLDDYLRMYASRDDRLTSYFSEDFSGFTGGGDFLV